MLFCGIDTSNYTTSAALCDINGNVIANLKRPLPVKDGERGLRQSDAVFAHVKNLPDIMREFSAFVSDGRICTVGVSARPRDNADSYMPCFLTGVAAAEAFCAGCSAPLYRFSHQQGHIMAAYHTSGAVATVKDEFLAFHISGGTTEMLKVKVNDTDLCISLVGGTADLNAGQAVDRIGVSLGFCFPCGSAMEKAAGAYSGKTARTKTSVKGLSCNLSGLENNAQKLIGNGETAEAVCAYVFDFLSETFSRLAQNARAIYGELPIVWAGGVMSNKIIQNRLSELGNCYFTQPEFSADNAVGIALLARKKYIYDNGL